MNITRDGYSARDTWQWSLYFNDSWKMGRATINWGLRWDRQDDKALAAEIEANPILPDLLPAVVFNGADAGVVYNDIAPRLGFTYDIFGTTRTVFKASVGRYYGAGLAISNNLSPTGQTTLSYWWKDQNGDLFAQRNEIEFNRGFRATPTSNYDPNNPSAVTTPAKVDPSIENDITDEFITGIDHELMANFGVGCQLHLPEVSQLPGLIPRRRDDRVLHPLELAGDVHARLRQHALRRLELHRHLLSAHDGAARPPRRRACTGATTSITASRSRRASASAATG